VPIETHVLLLDGLVTTVGPLLSICIATMNRGEQLGEQLSTLLDQIEGLSIEIVVADATPHPNVAESWRRHPQVRVLPLEQPNGVDADYALAVEAAKGRFCWFLSDDDRVRPGTVERILDQLRHEPSLVLLNAATYDSDLNELLSESRLAPGLPEHLAAPVTACDLSPFRHLLTFIPSIVVDRSLWQSRVDPSTFGSEFAHVTLLLRADLPRDAFILTAPQIDHRYGVGHWTSRAALVWDVKWAAAIDRAVADPAIRSRFYRTSDGQRLVSHVRYRATGSLTAATARRLQIDRPFRTRFGALCAGAIARLPEAVADVAMRCAGRLKPDARQLYRFDLDRARAARTA
jgi:glycosyltransferase involved in cell wall biosynthesis